MSTMKNLVTSTYHGEIAEGAHKAKLTNFVFNITNGLQFRAARIFPLIKKAMPADFDFSGATISIPVDQIKALFSTEFEPTTQDYFTATYLMENNREFKRNLFEKDLAIFLKQTRIQILNDNTVDIEPMEWIKSLLNKEITLYISYPIVPSRTKELKRVQNVNYCPKLTIDTGADEADQTTEEKPF